MSEAARDIIRSLLVREPHLRLTAEQILSDLWLEDLPPPVSLEWCEDEYMYGLISSCVNNGVTAPGQRRRRLSSSDYTIPYKRLRGDFENVDEEDLEEEEEEEDGAAAAAAAMSSPDHVQSMGAVF